MYIMIWYLSEFQVEHNWSQCNVSTNCHDMQVLSEQCFTSPPTQYRLYGRRFLQVKRPNQQHQSTGGDATKEKENN